MERWRKALTGALCPAAFISGYSDSSIIKLKASLVISRKTLSSCHSLFLELYSKFATWKLRFVIFWRDCYTSRINIWTCISCFRHRKRALERKQKSLVSCPCNGWLRRVQTIVLQSEVDRWRRWGRIRAKAQRHWRMPNSSWMSYLSCCYDHVNEHYMDLRTVKHIMAGEGWE